MDTKHEIVRAREKDIPVRVYREGTEDGWASGYVAGVGPEFFALELIDKSIRYDGYNCMRFVDVTRCDVPDPHSRFLVTALSMRGLRRRTDFAVDLSSISSLIRTAGAAFPVVTIHLETVDPETCYIGRVEAISEREVQIRPVTVDGVWGGEIETYAIGEITRVDFGGSYEDALVLVAGAG